MKKLFLTGVVALCTLAASAQFMVITDYDDSQDGIVKSLTANWGVGYSMGDFAIGFAAGDEDDTYDLWGRYNLGFAEGMYLSLQTAVNGENAGDQMDLGLGYSLNVWSFVYIEPGITYPLMEPADGGDREMNLRLGLAVKF